MDFEFNNWFMWEQFFLNKTILINCFEMVCLQAQLEDDRGIEQSL